MHQQHLVCLRRNAVDGTIILLFRDHRSPAQMEIAGNDANARLACQNRCVVCGRSCLRHTFYLSRRTEQAVCFRFPFLFKQIFPFSIITLLYARFSTVLKDCSSFRRWSGSAPALTDRFPWHLPQSTAPHPLLHRKAPAWSPDFPSYTPAPLSSRSFKVLLKLPSGFTLAPSTIT